MQNGLSRAVLQRKARAGLAAQNVQREKRLTDLAWQMNLTALTLSKARNRGEPVMAKVEAMHRRAEAEYLRVKAQAKH